MSDKCLSGAPGALHRERQELQMQTTREQRRGRSEEIEIKETCFIDFILFQNQGTWFISLICIHFPSLQASMSRTFLQIKILIYLEILFWKKSQNLKTASFFPLSSSYTLSRSLFVISLVLGMILCLWQKSMQSWIVKSSKCVPYYEWLPPLPRPRPNLHQPGDQCNCSFMTCVAGRPPMIDPAIALFLIISET